MKTFALVLLCSLVCVACAKPLTRLSDGQAGYAVYCEIFRDRCMDEIARLCRDKSYMIIAEHADEIVNPERPDWARATYRSRYWIEVRCDQF